MLKGANGCYPQWNGDFRVREVTANQLWHMTICIKPLVYESSI